MAATQGIKINKSIIEYFKMVMDFDNQNDEYCKVMEEEFKSKVEESLQSETIATLKFNWR